MRRLIRKLSRLGDHSNEQEIQSKNAKKVPALPELSSRFRDFFRSYELLLNLLQAGQHGLLVLITKVPVNMLIILSNSLVCLRYSQVKIVK